MKHTILMIACVCASTYGNAQITNGKVTYEEAMSMNAPDDLPAEAAMVRNMFGDGLHFTKTLVFSQDATVYKSEKLDKKEVSGSTDDGMQIQFHIAAPEEVTYTDLKSGVSVEQRDLMGRKFLVSGDAQRRKWNMTGKEKSILSYPCQEAVSYGNDTVVAWFTTAIPVSGGPQDWRGLPGMVLEAIKVQKDGSFTIKATKVEEGAFAIAPPKDGKKVTRAEYEKIQQEKIKEMREQMGSRGGDRNGGMIIRIER